MQSSNSTSQDLMASRQYQAALALNNVGVSLLERGCFRDAIGVMKKAFCHIRVFLEADSQVEIDSMDVNRDLNTSFQKLMHCRPSTDPMFPLEITSLPDDHLFEAAHSYPMSDRCYAIQIDTACDYFSSNFMLEFSIIMKNYAAAYRCYASEKSDDPKRQQKLWKSAFQILKTASEMLSYNIESQRNDEDDLVQERLELVLMLVMQDLMQIAFELNHIEEGRKYYSLLGDMHISQARRDPRRSLIHLQDVAPAA